MGAFAQSIRSFYQNEAIDARSVQCAIHSITVYGKCTVPTIQFHTLSRSTRRTPLVGERRNYCILLCVEKREKSGLSATTGSQIPTTNEKIFD
jgi:hypothetical protein